jgi:hypothetical protein
MMRLIALLAGVGAATSLAAKQPEAPAAAPDDLSVQALHNFASCIADTTPKGAMEVLALDYRSPEYAKRMNQFVSGHADGRCLAGRMSSGTVLLAGGMAERLLIEKVRPDQFASLVAYDAAKAPITARNATEMTAICVVRAEPARTYAIFRTEPTSADETHAMQAIAPTLMNCVKAGQKMSFNKPGLRASLALAAYRLTQPEPVVAADAKPMSASLVSQ